MAYLKDFRPGEQVFVAADASEWIGIEVDSVNPEDGVVRGRVVWTNDVPGFEVGDDLDFDEGLLAHKELTVQAVINRHNQS
ncbi:hypothetical protein [Micromonospora maritima]|uniref:hypothetical protein n=1 Tax=Micromonospora maritima TaxID=986711 RepID=UPI00157D8C65|nr:hypothetical protein [Micromonospora maritima]